MEILSVVFVFAALICSFIGPSVLVCLFLLQELRDDVDVYEVYNCEDILGLSAWNSLAIWEKFAAFILDILFELNEGGRTNVKGEY